MLVDIMQKVQMIGHRFGRLTVLEKVDAGKYQYKYLCQCDCGKQKVIASTSIRSGLTKSCGCIKSEMVTKKNYKHGQSKSSVYRSMYARLSHMKRKLRMPKWADIEAIRQIYLNKPIGCHVDHIIPLQGKLVSGLHIPENLQYLDAKENNRKQNFYEVI